MHHLPWIVNHKYVKNAEIMQLIFDTNIQGRRQCEQTLGKQPFVIHSTVYRVILKLT